MSDTPGIQYRIFTKLPGGGGALPLEGGTGMCRSHEPGSLFFMPGSLAYQFPSNSPLMFPPFSNFRIICIFSLVFSQNFSSQDAKFPNFRSQEPSFFKENPLPRPYFWNPASHIPTQKKLRSPLPPGKITRT